MKVDQPTRRPTNKLTAAIIAGAVVATARWALPALDDDALWVGLTPLVIWAAGYLVRDEANVDPYMTHEQRGI